MKKLVVPVTALLIGTLAALAAYNVLKDLGRSNDLPAYLSTIGEVTEVLGEVTHRLPRTVGTIPLTGPGPLYSQEVIHTGKASKAVLSLKSGTVLELKENSELVVELDSAKADALLGTLLAGEVELLNPGTASQFRLFKDGREIDPTRAAVPDVPVLKAEATVLTETPSAPALALPPADETAATPAPVAERPRVLPRTKGTPRAIDTLSDNEIRKHLKAQTAYFQRCYITYINRNRAARPGTLTVSFVIQPSGKTTDVRIMKTAFKDATLKKCVADVITRTPFRAFDSKPIKVREFPITLE